MREIKATLPIERLSVGDVFACYSGTTTYTVEKVTGQDCHDVYMAVSDFDGITHHTRFPIGYMVSTLEPIN